MRSNKTIFLLTGPKGSGKSFIGRLFEKHFCIPFVRVEDWAKKVKRDRSVEDEAYIKDVFAAIEEGIVQAIRDRDALVFESTGLTEHFDAMPANLKAAYKVVLIKIDAPLETCLTRVRSRDPAIHVDVSDAQVERINALVRQKDLKCDFVIENARAAVDELVAIIGEIIEHAALHNKGA